MTDAAPTTLDAALSKIDALLAVPKTVALTESEFNKHVASELEKALAAKDSPEIEKRLTHLKGQIETAKSVFAGGAQSVNVQVYADAWQAPAAPAGEVAVPQAAISPTGESNVQFMQDVIVSSATAKASLAPAMKGLLSIAKASDGSKIRKALVAKAGEEAAKTIVAKAGEALAVLEKIAQLFAYVPDDDESVLDSSFRWSVEETVRALQNAAKTEAVIAQMSGILAQPAPASNTTQAAKAATPTAPIEITTPDAWPADMAMVAKAGELVDAGPYWGLDSAPAPTT
jgi:hypothetical protein